MMILERLAALLPFALLLVVPAWSVVRLVGAVRAGSWRSPGWFARVAWTSLYLAVLVWVRGVTVGGLDAAYTCTAVHQQPYDEAFRQAHRAELFRLFPLSNRCNAAYDLVPPWVNPALLVLGALLRTGVVGVVVTRRRTRTRGSRSGDSLKDAAERDRLGRPPGRR